VHGVAAPAARGQSMAKRAIRTELKFTQLDRFRIAREGIFLLSVESPCSKKKKQQRDAAETKCGAFLRGWQHG
jgi:hypothetical protein